MSKMDHLDFANDVQAAIHERSPRSAWLQLFTIALFLSFALLWAHWAVLDEVTTGEGRVVPTSRLQVVQTLEGGIVTEIPVREGDMVEKDQLLMRIDDTDFGSKLGELEQKRLTLIARVARLEAEAKGLDALAADPALAGQAPGALGAETEVFTARHAKRLLDKAILESQGRQREEELHELEAQQLKLTDSNALLQRELNANRKLAKSGAVPEIELLKLERQMIEAKGEISILDSSLPKARAAVDEMRGKLAYVDSAFQADAREELAKALGDLAIIDESLRSAKQRVVRTALRAPVRGIVNRLGVTTIGAVAQPGFDLVEIVPVEDNLLIEVKIGPRDVAFIRPDQFARVKLTAYDYLLFGSLDGKVERISADTFTDQREQTFYRAMVRTGRNFIEKDGKTYPILPGMIANVDILTGRKSVLDYLLAPILRVGKESMRER
jgi:adhesin transport system membrane fusion protein